MEAGSKNADAPFKGTHENSSRRIEKPDEASEQRKPARTEAEQLTALLAAFDRGRIDAARAAESAG